jgi:NTE family protein
MGVPANLRSLAVLREPHDRWRVRVPGAAVQIERKDNEIRESRPLTLSKGARPVPAGGVAFVFQGGGSLTAPQVGMLWAFTEAGLQPELVIGSSAGALNAIAYASDPSPEGLDRLEAMWMSLRRRHVAPFSVRTLLTAVIGRSDGLVPNSALRELIEVAAVARTLRDTQIPAHVVVTDLISGAAVALSDGESTRALLASCAFPGLYAPVEVEGRLFVDGGVSADVPVLHAEALGASVTYVLPAAGYDVVQPRPRGALALAYHALGQMLDSADRRDVAAARGPVHVLPAPSSGATNPVDFRDTPRLIDEGYRLATDWLAGHVMAAGNDARTAPPPAGLATSRIVSAV